ncbi:MAG: FAD-dependent oxidoreductase [Hyphomonadaceae bacterium]|nr:FAD-dependent oxidoreductase [Hyphomonadaceae bacterium]
MTRIAVVGGGPSGLSLAKLLTERGARDITIFEAGPRPGGKSWTLYDGAAVAEMGTCYTTLSHWVVKRWMREKGIQLERNGRVLFDGTGFMKYVNQGGGPPFAVQALRYFWDGADLRRRLAKPNPSQDTINEAAMSILDWLRVRKLPKVELFLHRIITIMGYGFLDETPAVQAHRWCDIILFVSGALNQLHMPVEGWSEFWRRLAEDLDVRLNCPVSRIERNGDGVWLTSPEGREAFDWVVCAMPLDEFGQLVETPTDAEKFVNQSVQWQGYTTALVASDNWFEDWHVEGYSDTVVPGARLGRLVGARRETYEEELGGHLYVTGQLSRGLTQDELREIAMAELEAKGVNVTNFVLQKSWKYFAQYSMDAVRNGLLGLMRDMQGEQNTWYTGSTFSFEAVSHISNFNARLAKEMQRRSADRPATRTQPQ